MGDGNAFLDGGAHLLLPLQHRPAKSVGIGQQAVLPCERDQLIQRVLFIRHSHMQPHPAGAE